jgi:hypothetical protein
VLARVYAAGTVRDSLQWKQAGRAYPACDFPRLLDRFFGS